jgi:hypothetical protein
MHNTKMRKLICLVLVLGLIFSTGITTAYAGNATNQSNSLTLSSNLKLRTSIISMHLENSI